MSDSLSERKFEQRFLCCFEFLWREEMRKREFFCCCQRVREMREKFSRSRFWIFVERSEEFFLTWMRFGRMEVREEKNSLRILRENAIGRWEINFKDWERIFDGNSRKIFLREKSLGSERIYYSWKIFFYGNSGWESEMHFAIKIAIKLLLNLFYLKEKK